MSAELDAGLAALQRGDFASAIASLEPACQQNPNDYNAHMYLGAAYGQSNRTNDAVRVLTQAVIIQPSNPQARYNLGVAMERAGWPNEALQALQQAVVLQPNYPKAHEAIQRLQVARNPTLPPVALQDAPAAMPTLYSDTAAATAPTAYGAPAYEQPYNPPAQPLSGSPYGVPQPPPSPQQPYPPQSYPQPSFPTAEVSRPFAPTVETPANIAMGTVVGLALGAGCGFGFGYASVAIGFRVPFLTLLIGYIVGYGVLWAGKQHDFVLGIIAAVCATGAGALGLFIMHNAGVYFSPLAYIILAYAGYRAYVIASAM